MKKCFILLAVAALCMNVACKKDDEPINGNNDTTPDVTVVDGITSDGAIDALFSIDVDKTVQFSRGNLQYKASKDTWRFALNQYDCIGEKNGNVSPTYDGWIDFFAWATSGYDCGNAFFHPYDTDYEDYPTYLGYGPLGVYDLVGDYANCDWGVYNAISNGGNKKGMWRTLSKDEWTYLFEGRSNADQKYGIACVEGNNGMVLLPDNWVCPEGVTFHSGISNVDDTTEYSRYNCYDSTGWFKMQKAGAVFLPAGGFRDNEEMKIKYVGDMGNYWSVTAFGANPLLDFVAYDLCFYSNYLNPADGNKPRDYGCCVRLVRDK